VAAEPAFEIGFGVRRSRARGTLLCCGLESDFGGSLVRLTAGAPARVSTLPWSAVDRGSNEGPGWSGSGVVLGPRISEIATRVHWRNWG
jgi:hypothetical protein